MHCQSFLFQFLNYLIRPKFIKFHLLIIMNISRYYTHYSIFTIHILKPYFIINTMNNYWIIIFISNKIINQIHYNCIFIINHNLIHTTPLHFSIFFTYLHKFFWWIHRKIHIFFCNRMNKTYLFCM